MTQNQNPEFHSEIYKEVHVAGDTQTAVLQMPDYPKLASQMQLTQEQIAVRREWVKKLRSGEYAQGIGLLRNKKNQFCCLGVLCDMLQPEGWSKKLELFMGLDGYAHSHTGTKYPSGVILEKAGLSSFEGSKLAQSNDHGSMFNLIADMIEEETLARSPTTWGELSDHHIDELKSLLEVDTPLPAATKELEKC